MLGALSAFLNRRSEVRLLSGAPKENEGLRDNIGFRVDQTWASKVQPGSPVDSPEATPRTSILAELYLHACAAGAPCNDLALALANAVLDSDFVQLARAVLDSEQHRHAKATELAGRLLESAGQAFVVKLNDNGSLSR